MANEISVTGSLSCTNSNTKIPTLGGQFNVTQTTARIIPFGHELSTTEEDWDLTELTAQDGAVAILQNQGATNNVVWGIKVSSTYYPVGQIAPGESYPLKLVASTTYYYKAAASTTNAVVHVCDA